MTQNQKVFRKVLIALALVGIFLLGSIIKINFSATFSITLAAIMFIILIAFAIGLFLGYALGSGKNFAFWKDNTKKK